MSQDHHRDQLYPRVELPPRGQDQTYVSLGPAEMKRFDTLEEARAFVDRERHEQNTVRLMRAIDRLCDLLERGAQASSAVPELQLQIQALGEGSK